MSVRKSILLREIILNFATPSQVRKFDELAATNKGSATHFSLRLIQEYFKKHCENSSNIRENNPKPERKFVVRGYGQVYEQEY